MAHNGLKILDLPQQRLTSCEKYFYYSIMAINHAAPPSGNSAAQFSPKKWHSKRLFEPKIMGIADFLFIPFHFDENKAWTC